MIEQRIVEIYATENEKSENKASSMNYNFLSVYDYDTDNSTANSTIGPLSKWTTVEPYATWFVVFLWILNSIFCIETIFGNLLVLMAYKLERNIRRQLSNKFIVSLAISDLIIGMEGFPFLTVYVVERERWPLGMIMCQIWLCIDYTLCLVSILTVLLITVDRYCSVCYPAKYRMWQTENKIRLMIVLSWVVPFGFFGLMIFGWEALTTEKVEDAEKCYAPFLNDPYVNMSMYIAYYWTTLVAMSVLYRGIHKAARTLEEKSKAKEKQTMALLLGQRCMAQVGVGILMHNRSQAESDDRDDSNTRMKPEYTAEYTELVHDSGYITAGNTTTTTSTTVATRRSIDIESKNGVKEILEEETEETPSQCVQENTENVRKATIVEQKDLLDFDNEEEHEQISELPTPTQPDQPTFVSLSRGSSYNRRFHTRLSLKLKHQDSGCSLELYDGSSCSSSLFADSSITSVLNFEAILPMLDFIEEVSLLDAPLFPEIIDSSNVSTNGKECLRNKLSNEIELNTIKQNGMYSSPKRFPNTLQSTPIPATVFETEETVESTPLSPQSDQRLLETPFANDRKRLLTPPSNTNQQSKQTLLTVPKQSALNRQRNPSSRAGKRGNSEDYYRESWQSTLSIEEREKLNLVAEDGQQVDDDEDSGGSKQDVISSGEDSSSEKRSGSWVATLFTNPTWLLHRRRKVTKAEQRARKAFRTISVIVGTFALFWSPYYIVATIYGFCPSCVPVPIFFTSYYLCYLNSSMNPFAYAFANRLFRKTFVRILRGDFRRT